MKKTLLCAIIAIAAISSQATAKGEKKQKSADTTQAAKPAGPKIYSIQGNKEDMIYLLQVLQETNVRWKEAHPVIAGAERQLVGQGINEPDTPAPAPAPEKIADTTASKK